ALLRPGDNRAVHDEAGGAVEDVNAPRETPQLRERSLPSLVPVQDVALAGQDLIRPERQPPRSRSASRERLPFRQMRRETLRRDRSQRRFPGALVHGGADRLHRDAGLLEKLTPGEAAGGEKQ